MEYNVNTNKFTQPFKLDLERNFHSFYLCLFCGFPENEVWTWFDQFWHWKYLILNIWLTTSLQQTFLQNVQA